MNDASVHFNSNVNLDSTFKYICQLIDGPSLSKVEIRDYLNGCECKICDETCPCGQIYQYDGKLKDENLFNKALSYVLRECGSFCLCAPECSNHQSIQDGVKIAMEVKRTETDKGYGVYALETISKGEFVCQYVGEEITDEELIFRQKKYENNLHRHNYLLSIYEHVTKQSVEADNYDTEKTTETDYYETRLTDYNETRSTDYYETRSTDYYETRSTDLDGTRSTDYYETRSIDYNGTRPTHYNKTWTTDYDETRSTDSNEYTAADSNEFIKTHSYKTTAKNNCNNDVANSSLEDDAANLNVVESTEPERSKTIATHVDATFFGNVARWMNHSCEPNLVIVPIRVNTPTPHAALFACRDIRKGEELVYNYGANVYVRDVAFDDAAVKDNLSRVAIDMPAELTEIQSDSLKIQGVSMERPDVAPYITYVNKNSPVFDGFTQTDRVLYSKKCLCSSLNCKLFMPSLVN